LKILKYRLILSNKWKFVIKTFSLYIDTINGVVQEQPQQMFFYCKEVVPQGLTIVRYFDLWMNQHAHKTFYLFYNGNQFGTQQFKTFDDYNKWILWNCCSGQIFGLVNGCFALINGNRLNLN